MYLVAYLCVISFGKVLAQTEAPRVVVAEGQLEGLRVKTRNGKDVYGFLGIPFAKPPLLDLRFRSPLPPESWSGIRLAIQDGPPCTQNNLLDFRRRNVTYGSEDCLYLNVFTPTISATAKLPVMFYIHGGGFTSGSSDSAMYGPQFLLDQDVQVVLVAANYRLGPLGFLSTEDDALPGNYGLKDQTLALRWVQRNIHVFGGNKDSVTIFGNSAGGASVHLHMMSPLSKGMFHGAISESGSALCQWSTHPPGTYRNIAFRAASVFGCTTTNTFQLAECLRRVPAESITSLLEKFLDFDEDPIVAFPPVVESNPDGAFLQRDPWTLTTSVPWIAGTVSEEGALRTASLIKQDAKDLQRLNSEYLNLLPASLMVELTAQDPRGVAETVKQFYFGNRELSLDTLPQVIDMFSDSWFFYCIAEAVKRHKGPVYYYRFSYSGNHSIAPVLTDSKENLGVVHSSELIYLFPLNYFIPDRIDSKQDTEFSKKIVELWTNFAKYRNPTPTEMSVTKWEPVSSADGEYLDINNKGFVMRKNLLTERYNFWSNLNFREKPDPLR